MRECGKCKSNEYTNKNLVMMVNECGHPLCKNCVDNLFSRNAGPCHVCGKTLRRNNFWEQVFDDPLIEKETHIRRRLRKIYNLKKDDFPSLKEFNDYLERFEYIVCNLACGIDVEETEAEVAAFKERNAELIERNKKRLDEDQLWILQNLKEDRDMKNRVDLAHNQENKEVEKSAVHDTKAIMDELRESNVPAEVILDRERKRQIEQELEEKEEAARRKNETKKFCKIASGWPNRCHFPLHSVCRDDPSSTNLRGYLLMDLQFRAKKSWRRRDICNIFVPLAWHALLEDSQLIPDAFERCSIVALIFLVFD